MTSTKSSAMMHSVGTLSEIRHGNPARLRLYHCHRQALVQRRKHEYVHCLHQIGNIAADAEEADVLCNPQRLRFCLYLGHILPAANQQQDRRWALFSAVQQKMSKRNGWFFGGLNRPT